MPTTMIYRAKLTFNAAARAPWSTVFQTMSEAEAFATKAATSGVWYTITTAHREFLPAALIYRAEIFTEVK